MLSEDKVSGVLSAERFAIMSSDYENEQKELRAENATLQSELDSFTADGERADKFIALVRRYTRFEELTNAMIHEFVDTIVIYESVWSEQSETERRKGYRTQEIDINLKYIGKFDVPDTCPQEEIEAERIAEEKLQRKRAQKRDSERRRREKRRAEEAAAVKKETGISEAASDIPKAKKKTA